MFVAHSLRLSSALLAAGYPHSVLPLSGITHMTSQEAVAENLLLLQVAFLKQALGMGGRRRSGPAPDRETGRGEAEHASRSGSSGVNLLTKAR